MNRPDAILTRRRHSVWGQSRWLYYETLEARTLLAADLVAQWRADDAVAIGDDGVVAEWVDSMGEAKATVVGEPRLVKDAWGGRAAMRFEPSDGDDAFRVHSLSNPLAGAEDFAVTVMFATASTSLAGDSNGPWFESTGLVDSNALGFGNDWGVVINADGQIGAGLGFGLVQPPVSLYSNDRGLNDGALHSTTFTRSGTNMSIYIDGVLAGSRTDGNDAALSELDMSIGRLETGDNPFAGDITEIRVFDGALADVEAADVHLQLVSYYNNSKPQAVDDRYEVDEDPVLYIIFAENGVLHNDLDDESDPLTVVVIEGPKHGTVGLNPDGSFIYDAHDNFFGTDTFTYAAVDTRMSEPATVTIVVRPVYDPASPVEDAFKAVPSEVLRVDANGGLLVNDLNPDRAQLRSVLHQDVDHGRLMLNEDGSFEYDPQGFAGTATFQYRVDDGTSLSAAAGVSIVVNTTPVVGDDGFSLDEDSLLSVSVGDGLLRNDIDADGDRLVVLPEQDPAHGSLGVQGNGAFLYTPDPEYFGDDQFTYRVTDGVDTSTVAVVNLTVRSVNDVPVAWRDSYFTLPDQTLNIPASRGLLANDKDVENTALRAVLVTPPENGRLTLSEDGSFQYIPRDGFAGNDLFTYKASDTSDMSDVTEVQLSISARPVVINEIMALNATALETRTRYNVDQSFFGDPDRPDWIELKNLVSEPLNIGGMHLTDDPGFPTRWSIPPDTVIPADSFIVIFASGEDIRDVRLDQTGRLHTNFSLDSDGDYLAITSIDGSVIHEIGPFRGQAVDVSFGLLDDRPLYFDRPTPGATNQGGLVDIVADTAFSVGRGFYDEPIEVRITTSTVGATIVYTTDGDEPTLTQGTKVEAADVDSAPAVTLTIDETTTLRAAAFKQDFVPTNVDTQTYLFLDGIMSRSNLWRTVTDSEVWGTQLRDSFLSLPTISLVLEDRIGQREVGTSVEMIYPDGVGGFQIDAGVEHYGGHSINSPKKNMRLSFKSIYGDSKLNYDLFGGDAIDEFNQILLRTGSHDTWFWTHPGGGRGNYTRNRWAFDRQLEMGQPAPHGRYVHVYINGQYWGMHHLMERPNASFMASYLGGYEKDYDALNAGAPIDGDTRAWSRLQRDEVIDDYEILQQYLDLDNYADYMLLQFYGGNDWDWNADHNWAGARKREEGAGYVFFAWDSDVMLRTTATANVISRGGPGNLWNIRGGVKQHEEFRLLMADRAHKYFFNDGMFTNERFRSDIQAMADRIRLPVIAETARWGRSGQSYTPATWEAAIKWMVDRFAPEDRRGRTETVISQLRRARVYPSVDAPEYSVNGARQHGGLASRGDLLGIVTDNGSTYYTLDGSDPRLPGGILNPDALIYDGSPITLSESVVVKARTQTEDEWSALSDAEFSVDIVAADVSNLRVSEVNYHPSDPTTQELTAGHNDADDFEFIELVNLTDMTLDLANVRLARVQVDGADQGVEFEFSSGAIRTLAPHQRLVVVEDLAAFQTRYGTEIPVAGQWSGGLSNRQEQITLLAGDVTIHQFEYVDTWQAATDGAGRTLEIIDELAELAAWSRSESWRASATIGGSPGSSVQDGSIPGDSNRDGAFDSSDLVLVFQAGEYEDGIPKNSSWEDGDWNGDGDFTTLDFVLAFQAGHYVARAVAIEPLGLWDQQAAAGADLWPDETVQRLKLRRTAPARAKVARESLEVRLELAARDLIFERSENDDGAVDNPILVDETSSDRGGGQSP